MKLLSKRIILLVLLVIILVFALVLKQFYKINSKYLDVKQERAELYMDLSKERSEVFMDLSNVRAKCKVTSTDLMQMRLATPIEILKRHYLSPEYILSIYQLMKDTHQIFEKFQIVYWVDGGALLGTMRNKGQIPYDDDIDIFVPEEHEKILEQEAFEYFKKLGYQVSKFRNAWYKITDIVSGAFMDIFIAERDQKSFRQKNTDAQSAWPKFYYKEEYVFPLQLHDFGEIQVYVPNNPDDYLERGYGKNYKSKAVFSGNHYITGNIGQVLEIDVKEDSSLTAPAKPTGPLLDRVE